MRERPILFGAPMVRAILAGTKTQTRRIMKPRRDRYVGCELALNELAGEVNAGDYTNAPMAPGDRLWVREAHYIIGEYREVFFRATQDSNKSPPLSWPGPWRPSIHMPRWASRITLEVTGVRCERLRDISEADAQAEGVERTVTGDGWRRYADPSREAVGLPPFADARSSFRSLWEHINGTGSWDANPWIWVVSFRRLDAKEAGS